MAFEARKEADPEIIQESRRFIPPDFDKIGIWLISRLSRKYTHLTDRQILSWLRGVMESSSYLFLTNDTAVLLAVTETKDMDTEPSVREVFCVCKDGSYAAGAALYGDLTRWAHQLGASQVSVMNFSDIPRPMIEECTKTAMRKLNAYSLPV